MVGARRLEDAGKGTTAGVKSTRLKMTTAGVKSTRLKITKVVGVGISMRLRHGRIVVGVTRNGRSEGFGRVLQLSANTELRSPQAHVYSDTVLIGTKKWHPCSAMSTLATLLSGNRFPSSQHRDWHVSLWV